MKVNGPLEKLLRSWAVKFGTIHVILGSILDADRDGSRDRDGDYIQWVGGAGGVAVPTHFYAVVVRCVDGDGVEPADCKTDQLDAVGMLFQHPTEAGVSRYTILLKLLYTQNFCQTQLPIALYRRLRNFCR